MQSFSSFFLPAFRAAVPSAAMKPLLKLTGQHILLPVYHLVRDKEVAHVKHLYSVRNTNQFRKDLEFFLSCFKPADLFHLRKITNEKIKVIEPFFCLSFDDGLSQVYDVALPLLKRMGVPAAVFINPAFLDNREMFFRHKASILTDRLKQKKPTAGEKQLLKKLFTGYGVPRFDFLRVHYVAKELLDRAAGILSVDFNEYLKNEKPYLTSEQVSRLIGEGFLIGAHSMDHPEYRHISHDEQIRQTSESIQFLKNRFHLNYSLFAFPFTDMGVFKKFFLTIEQEKIAEMTFGCAGLKKDAFPWHHQRIPMEKSSFAAGRIAASEYAYFMLKGIVGKNIIRRS